MLLTRCLKLTAQVNSSRIMKEFVSKLIIGAMLSWMYDFCLGHPLEFMKVSMQTQVHGSSYSEIWTAVTSDKGWWGILDGFFPWGSLQSITKGAAFSFSNAVAFSLLSRSIPERQRRILAGGIGGFCQGLINTRSIQLSYLMSTV